MPSKKEKDETPDVDSDGIRKAELDNSMGEKGGKLPIQERASESLKIGPEPSHVRFERQFETTNELLAARNTAQQHCSEEDGKRAYEELGLQLEQEHEDDEEKLEGSKIIHKDTNSAGEPEPPDPNKPRESDIECDSCGRKVTRAAKCPAESLFCQHFS